MKHYEISVNRRIKRQKRKLRIEHRQSIKRDIEKQKKTIIGLLAKGKEPYYTINTREDHTKWEIAAKYIYSRTKFKRYAKVEHVETRSNHKEYRIRYSMDNIKYR